MGQKGAIGMERLQPSPNHILPAPCWGARCAQSTLRLSLLATALRYPTSETGTARLAPQRPLPEVAGRGAAAAEHPTLPDAGGRWRPRGAAARGGGAGRGGRYLGSGRTILLLARAAGVALLFSIAIR